MVEKCNDAKCPFHGKTRVRGLALEGTIIKKDIHGTATFEKPVRAYVRKYERYEKRRTRLHVHNPVCINAQKGDKVKIMECKPLSKTKKFVIVSKLGHDVLFAQKEEARAESKIKPKKKEEKPDQKAEENPKQG
jgi:small subunit ribosomal protein S17